MELSRHLRDVGLLSNLLLCGVLIVLRLNVALMKVLNILNVVLLIRPHFHVVLKCLVVVWPIGVDGERFHCQRLCCLRCYVQ